MTCANTSPLACCARSGAEPTEHSALHALGQHQHRARARALQKAQNKNSRELSVYSRSRVWGDGRDESVEPSKALNNNIYTAEPKELQPGAPSPLYRWADEQRCPGLPRQVFRKCFLLPALILYPPHSKDTWPVLAPVFT